MARSPGACDDPGEDDGEDGDGGLDGVRVRHLRLPDGDVRADRRDELEGRQADHVLEVVLPRHSAHRPGRIECCSGRCDDDRIDIGQFTMHFQHPVERTHRMFKHLSRGGVYIAMVTS